MTPWLSTDSPSSEALVASRRVSRRHSFESEENTDVLCDTFSISSSSAEYYAAAQLHLAARPAKLVSPHPHLDNKQVTEGEKKGTERSTLRLLINKVIVMDFPGDTCSRDSQVSLYKLIIM